MEMSQVNSSNSLPKTNSSKTGTRELCYLCDLPRMPWSLIYDFSEVVCRGCINYEGTDRIEHVIQQARLLKLQHGIVPSLEPIRNRISKTTCNSNKGEGKDVSLIIPPVNNTQYSNSKADPPQSPQRQLSIADSVTSPVVETLPSPVRTTAGNSVVDLTRQYTEKLVSIPTVSQPVTHLMSPAASLAYRQGMAAARIAAASWSQKNKLPFISGMVGGIVPGDGFNSPQTPSEEHKPLTAPLNLDYSTKPAHVISVLQGLAKCTPFEVRFKKAHSERGRVFAFDAVHKSGLEYELRLFIEYPIASGQVYTSASGVAKQMYYNSMKELSKPLSSGFKYLEYEVRPDTGDWRLIGDLLPENVRAFKEPFKEEFLPVARVDPNYPTLPKFTLNTGLEVVTSNSEADRKSAERKSPKRKQISESSQASATPAKRAPLGSPSAARRPNSLSLSIPTPSPISEGLPGSATRLRPPVEAMVEKLTPTEVNNHHSLSNQSSSGSSRSSVSEERSTMDQRMKCYLCCSQLEDAHYVQCPTVRSHKFCFPCSKDSIKHQQVGSKKDVFCPSGKQCPLESGNVPWAFLPKEIAHILATYSYPKYSNNPDRPASKERDEITEQRCLERSNSLNIAVKQERDISSSTNS